MSASQRGDLDDALALLESARRGFELNGDRVGLGETLLELVSTASLQQDPARRAALAQQALALPLPVHGQVQLLMARVWELLHQGDLTQADVELGKALDTTLQSRDVRAFNVIAPIFSMHLALLPSGTARLASYCRQVLSIFSEGAGPLQGSAHAMLGYILFLRGSLAEASLEIERAREISQQVGCFAMNESQMHYVTGLLMAAKGDYAGAEHYWASVLPWIEQTPSLRFFKFAYLYVIGRMQWMEHKFEQASVTNTRIAMLVDPKELPYVGQIRRVMQALVEISENRYTDAERTLHQALAIEERFRPSVGLGSARVLLAYLHLKCHREREAWSQFAPVLDEYRQKGLPGLILLEYEIAIPLLQLAKTHSAHKEFAMGLLDSLAAAGEMKPVPVPDTGETLTAREVEILKLVAGGASNQAIAQTLVISAHTVKVHMTNILAKLRVSSRTQAASLAHELHLV
jgi:ATP/maltotriose-dependent transcriptional regulator MalT